MRSIITSIRSLNKKNCHNLMKIASLGIGLAAGLVLIAKVYFEQSFDQFYPNNDRIYQVWSKYKPANSELMDHPRTSGGIAPSMAQQIPEIEAVTRFTDLGDWTIKMVDTQRSYNGYSILADSCLLDLLPLPIITGEPKEVLSSPNMVMISSRLANNIGGDVIGKRFTIESDPGVTLTIGGVYEEIPLNAHYRYDIIVSMASIKHFLWSGSETNMLGNDRYVSYIKLHKGVDPAAIEGQIGKFVESYFPKEDQEKSGLNISFTLHRLDKLHKEQPETLRATWTLSIIAFALILTAVLNYILIFISSVVVRSKEVAVHKCYGAGGTDIHKMMLGETFVHMVLSLILASFIIFMFRGSIEEILGTSPGELFLSKGCLLLVVVCIMVFLVSALLPGSIFAKIPVAYAFKRYSENKRIWKRALLTTQFIAAGFMVALLANVGRQYNMMINVDTGYSYENLAYCHLSGVDSTSRDKVIDEIERLPEVEIASSCFHIPLFRASGNNAFLPSSDKELFNVADMYWVSDGYFDLMEIPIIQGKSFTEGVHNSNEIMVDRNFVEKMKIVAGWDDNVVGRSIEVTEHNKGGKAHTICGVYENFRIGGIDNQDTRPSVMFYSKGTQYNILVKFHNMTNEGMERVNNRLKELYPDRDINLLTFKSEMEGLYRESKRFRDSILIGSVITIIIVFLGLIGYTNDEANRRHKEIAIRRVNGASQREIIKMFISEISILSIISVSIGEALSYIMIDKWQEQFSEKVPLSLYIFIGCAILVLAIIYSIIVINIKRSANQDLSKSLKAE